MNFTNSLPIFEADIGVEFIFQSVMSLSFHFVLGNNTFLGEIKN